MGKVKRITIRFDEEIYNKIKKEAEETKRSINSMVNILCERRK